MSCEQIHETVISDIKDIINGAINIADGKFGPKKSYSSIAKATSNLTAVFPVLISRNVPIETAQMVTKACERDATSMLQILFSAMSVTTAKDGIEYVKKIHNNINLGNGIDLDKYMDVMSVVFPNESAQITYREAYDLVKKDMRENTNYTLDDSISERGLNEYFLSKIGNMYYLNEASDKIEYPDDLTNEKMKNGVESFLDDRYFEDFINFGLKKGNDDWQSIYQDIPDKIKDSAYKAYTKIAQQNKNLVTADNIRSNPELGRLYDTFKNYRMDQDGLRIGDVIKMVADIENFNLSNLRAKNSQEDLKNQKDEENKIAERRYKLDVMGYQQRRREHTYQKKKDSLDFDYRRFKDEKDFDYRKQKDEKDFAYKVEKDKIDRLIARNDELYKRNSKMLIDTDVKKANEMIPTLMNVTFTQIIKDTPILSSIVIGVKAKMIPLDSMDIMNRIINKNKDNNFFIKFFRSTTREISFVKDFVLAIDKAKSDALSFSTKGKSNKIWKVLEKRASKSKASRIVNTNNSAMAISTLIITSEEAEALKKMNNIDVYNPKIAGSIMESYNLLAFGIVDDMMETFKIMRDNGDYSYETYAYSALEKELSDSQAKKTLNLMAKIAK